MYICIPNNKHMIRLNTNLNNLNHREIRRIVDKTIRYSVFKFVINKRKGCCTVVVKNQSKNAEIQNFGEYNPDTNTIYIFKNNCKNVKDVIETTLHEYAHTLQPIVSRYYKMLKTHGYEKHPMEIEARKHEKYCKEAWILIK
jgi:hypothetical protein